MIFLHPFPDVQSRVKLKGLTSMLGNYFRSAIWLWLLSKWRLNLAMQETKSLVNYKPTVKFIGFQTTEHYFYRWCSFYFRFFSVSIQYEVPRCGSTAVSSFPCHECLYRDPSDLWRRLRSTCLIPSRTLSWNPREIRILDGCCQRNAPSQWRGNINTMSHTSTLSTCLLFLAEWIPLACQSALSCFLALPNIR